MHNNIKIQKVIKDFKALQFMRTVRAKISADILDLNFEQIKKYFEERKFKLADK